jgi:hypothetical protein
MERRAIEQAKRVPWRRLAETADEYSDWQLFTLWVRARVDVAKHIPAAARSEMDRRVPGFSKVLGPRIESAAKQGDRPGEAAWQALERWAEMNVFLSAKREGWMDAVHYFSAMSLISMKAWSHWERIDTEWRRAPPLHPPTLQEWDRVVATVSRLSNADSAGQRTLDSMQSMPGSDWSRLQTRFFGVNTFSVWMELGQDFAGPQSALISWELRKRYPLFRLPCPLASKEAVRALNKWVISHELPDASRAGILAALKFQLRHHPEWVAIRNYAQRCRGTWPDGLPRHWPIFDEWKHAADGYSESN